MARAYPEFPERLVDTDSHASLLIQRALAEPVLEPSEQQSWRRLRDRSRRSRARWVWPALSLGVLAVALLRLWPQRSSDVELRADVWQRRPEVAPSAPARTEEPKVGASGASAAVAAEREERGAELLVLRAELLATQGDCLAALEAVLKARHAGLHPSRLERTVAACRDRQRQR